MADFFKQLIKQLSDVWSKLNSLQKILTTLVFTVTLMGLIGLIVWSSAGNKSGGYVTLFSGLELSESGMIVEKLREGNEQFKIVNGGSTIQVPKKRVYELRMVYAKMGLPKTGGIGYEIFDKTNLGMTDFVQKLNYKRALEGELSRTIEQLQEIEKARVHIVIPKETIFIRKQKEATASIVLKLRPGVRLSEGQIKGVANLIAFSIEGLERRNISIIDTDGNVLSDAFGDTEIAERTSNQMQLTNKIEKTYAKKAQDILDGILGVGKAYVKTTVELDFEQVTKTDEVFDPESKVVRSEERSENAANGAPSGNEKGESSITNYEINKSISHIIGTVGAIKNLSVSVVVDGIYGKDKEGEATYTARTAEELLKIESLIKRAVGFDGTRGDQLVVSNIKFDRQFLNNEIEAMEAESRREMIIELAKGLMILLIIIAFIFFLRSLAKNIIDALNPPVPSFVGIGEDEDEEAAEEEVARSNEIITKIEMLAKQDTKAVASLIKTWLNADANPGSN